MKTRASQTKAFCKLAAQPAGTGVPSFFRTVLTVCVHSCCPSERFVRRSQADEHIWRGECVY